MVQSAASPSAPPADSARQSRSAAFLGIVGRSAVLREAVALVNRVAQSRGTTVLIAGETGSGKELFARGVHLAGETAEEPFVAVNCAAIPEQLLESELFGHERGAFTDARAARRGLMELAGNGTLFLDEVHQLPFSLQPKLLRALEERKIRRLGGEEELEIHCRIVAATNLSLEDAVSRGEFREDLFYRLNVFTIVLPPLRDRPEDVAPLAARFLSDLTRDRGLAPTVLTAEALETLRRHRWPGNVRELRNVLERAVILAGAGGVIKPSHLVIQQRTNRPLAASGDPRTQGGDIHVPPGGKSLREIEHEAVLLALRMSAGNRSEAARMLGISRPTLARKLREASPHPDITDAAPE